MNSWAQTKLTVLETDINRSSFILNLEGIHRKIDGRKAGKQMDGQVGGQKGGWTNLYIHLHLYF